MPSMRLYQNGLTAYMGGTGDHVRAPRGEVVGWSDAAARRQTRWLWKIDAPALTGYGFAVTLTMTHTPDTAAEFHRLRRAWIKRAERHGAVRIHWVIEWQRRGTPHIHAAVYFDEAQAQSPAFLAVDWCAIAEPYVAELWSQTVKPITGVGGWLKYLSKHAARGARHYQRQGHPDGWQKTGRLWGYCGQWPVIEPMELPDLSNREFYRVRRIVRAWAVADARKAGDWKRVRYLRRAGRPDTEKMSRCAGVAEWIPEDVSLRLVDLFERENRAPQGDS